MKGKKQVHFSDQVAFDCPILYANMIGYATQCLLMVEKWISLADLCQRFNQKTTNSYAVFLLPFAIYAQTVLHKRNEQNTLDIYAKKKGSRPDYLFPY